MVPLNKLIYDLVEEIAGKDVIPLIDLLWGKENVSEFKLADKLEITVNLVRNMLYKLNSHNLVDFIRRKDKRKGWYIYYWTFDLKKALELLTVVKKDKIVLLRNSLNRKQVEDYFNCPRKCVIFRYDSAMEHDFRCPECGSILKRLDMKKQVSQIKKQIETLKIELESVKIYLEKEEERLLKKKIRMEKRKKKVKKPKKRVKKKIKKKAKKKKVKKIKKKHKKKVKKKAKKKTKKIKKIKRKRR